MTTSEPLYCIDMGTTRSRVWLVEGERVWAHTAADFGVRDVARGGSATTLRQNLNRLIEEAGQLALQSGMKALPVIGVGAGMITSPQGLLAIPHIPAPATGIDLARNMQAYSLNESPALTIFLVPGVKTVASHSSAIEAALVSDLIRGEEALCVGLLAAAQIKPNSAVLHLGSHWKWILIDAEGRIGGSHTSLTGELIHATQSQTLLASALPQDRPSQFDAEWLTSGSREYLRSGLTRSLFCVRLLEQSGNGTPAQRLSFMYGAFLEAEVEAFKKFRQSHAIEQISVVGLSALASAWQQKLSAMHLPAQAVDETQREHMYLLGLQQIFHAARLQNSLPSPF